MRIDITATSLQKLSDYFGTLDAYSLSLVLLALAEIGITVTRFKNGFCFESSLDYAKRRVVEELINPLRKETSHEKAFQNH